MDPAQPSDRPRPPFEITEHTADIGLRAFGSTLAELFENACRGTLEIMGAVGAAATRRDTVEASAEDGDVGGLLVDLLNELIWLVDGRNARVADVRVELATPSRVRASFGWEAGRGELAGTELKAATYHRLAVDRTEERSTATVYFDV